MISEKSVIAVIPARGGSKGLPGKNIKCLNGHPLIAYTISAALRSTYIDRVLVTTDSEEIRNVALRYGASAPFIRPSRLAGDCSKSIDVLLHALYKEKELGYEFDIAVLLQPTSPLRIEAQIDRALELFCNRGCLGLASVCAVAENPILTRRIDSSGVLHPILPMSSTVRRQDMSSFYHVDGSIYINSVDELSVDTSLNDNPIGYVMPKDRAIDIDCLDDFLRAEDLLSQLGDPRPIAG